MARKTIDQLKQQSDKTFFDNTAGEITPAGHRAFNDDLLESAAIESDWTDLTDDLTGGMAIGGSLSIDEFLAKRVGDVILISMTGTISLISTVFSVSYEISESVFILDEYEGGGVVFATQNNRLLKFDYGEEFLTFTLISGGATSKPDSFIFKAALPCYSI
jgi:hypothetical protein